jgi:hypothetical protein
MVKASNWNNCVIEYTIFRDCSSGDMVNVHPDTIYFYPCSNVTVRYCRFENVDSESIFFDYGGSTGIYMYGNVMVQGTGQSSSAIELKQGYTWGTFFLYNNVFVGWTKGVVYRASAAAGSMTKNNIFFNCANSTSGATSDYNGYIGTSAVGSHAVSSAVDPFVSTASGDFHLKSGTWPIGAGTNLGSPYDFDGDGNSRGTLASWDLGAYASGGTATPVLVLSSNQLDFGAVTIGTFKDLSVTVTNNGAGTLSGAVTVSTPFSVISGGSYSLTASQSQTVIIRYSPTATVTNTGSASLTGGNGGSIALSGSGLQAPATPVITVAPTSLDFGSVTVGTSKEMSFTVQNTGGNTLSGTATTSVPFSIVAGASYSLTGGQSQIVTARYSPTVAANHNGSVALSGGNGAAVSVSGSGIAEPTPAISLTPAVLNFGSIPVGTTKASAPSPGSRRSFTISRRRSIGGRDSGGAGCMRLCITRLPMGKASDASDAAGSGVQSYQR